MFILNVILFVTFITILIYIVIELVFKCIICLLVIDCEEIGLFKFSGKQQKAKIITGGYEFEKEREFPNGRTRWRCSHHANCCANIYTIDNDVVLFYDKHNHK